MHPYEMKANQVLSTEVEIVPVLAVGFSGRRWIISSVDRQRTTDYFLVCYISSISGLISREQNVELYRFVLSHYKLLKSNFSVSVVNFKCTLFRLTFHATK